MFYFFNVGFKTFSIYILCSQEKIIFLMWDLKPFSIYTYVHKKKVMFFQYRIKKHFNLK
jgi:hypothetical protein